MALPKRAAVAVEAGAASAPSLTKRRWSAAGVFGLVRAPRGAARGDRARCNQMHDRAPATNIDRMSLDLPSDEILIGEHYYTHLTSDVATGLPKLVLGHDEAFLMADQRGDFPNLPGIEFGF
jgi:hypothetical protein